MKNFKNLIIEEIEKTMKAEMNKKKIMESSKNLFEAVTLASQLKKEGKDEEKIKMAEGLVHIAETQLSDKYDKIDGDCECGEEGEGRMFKAQLLSIMKNAQKLYHMVDEEDQMEDWIQSKITIAEDYLRAAYGYLTYFNGEGEGEMGDDWGDDEDEDWDDIEEEDWDEDLDDEEDEEQYNEALNPNIDDDALFESKRK